MKNATHPTQEEMLQAIDGELEPSDHARVDTHLANCGQCLGRYEDLAQLSETLNHAIETAPVAAPASARQRLEAALENSRGAHPIQPVAIWKWVAVAAGLVLLLLLFRQQPTPPRQTAAAISKELPTAPRETAIPHAVPVQALSKKRGRPSSHHARGPDYGFIRLPYSDPSLPIDSADVVRVQLHLSALADTGVVRVLPGASDPLVQADVLLGLDGQPSAIRILQPGVAK